MSEQELATPSEAVDDVVQSEQDQTPEAVESTEGQDQHQPADSDDDSASQEDEKVSQSKQRRERRKAEMTRLKESEAKALAEAESAAAELDRVKQILEGQTRPQEADYPDPFEYQAALAAYNSIRTLDERQVSDAERKAQAAKERVDGVSVERKKELAENWNAQVAIGKTRYTDFDEKVNFAPISDDVAHMIAGLDDAADIAYHLGTHRDEAAALSNMSLVEAAMEIGRLESRIAAPRPKIETSAPDPINPVRAKATSGKDPLKMNPTEYQEWRENGGTF